MRSNGRSRKSRAAPEFRKMVLQRKVFRGESWLRTELIGLLRAQIKSEHLVPGSQFKKNSPLQESRALQNGWTLVGIRRYNKPASGNWLLNYRPWELFMILGGLPTSSLSDPLPAPRWPGSRLKVKLLRFEFSFLTQGQRTKICVSVYLYNKNDKNDHLMGHCKDSMS